MLVVVALAHMTQATGPLLAVLEVVALVIVVQSALGRMEERTLAEEEVVVVTTVDRCLEVATVVLE